MSDFHKKKEENRKNKTYTLTQAQIDAIKDEASSEAMDAAFILMLGLPVMVLHDHMNDLWKKEIGGIGREERFANMVLDLYDSFNRGYITLDDVIRTLNNECEVSFIKNLEKTRRMY